MIWDIMTLCLALSICLFAVGMCGFAAGRRQRDYWKSYAEDIEKSKATYQDHCDKLEAENRSLRDWATDTIDTCPIKEQDMPF